MVTGILADHNLEGHIRRMVARMQQPPWQEFWENLGIGAFTLADLGLAVNTSDAEVWRVCQTRGLILITGNRNHDGPDSLNATIQTEGTPDSLPVMTVADALTLRDSREYAERVIERLLEYLTSIDNVRGTGRLYLP
jgi:predicted nuclease of predicted toxin-antitoxin system